MLCLLPRDAQHTFQHLASRHPFAPRDGAPAIHANTEAVTTEHSNRAAPCVSKRHASSMPGALCKQPCDDVPLSDNDSTTSNESVEAQTTCSSPASCAATQPDASRCAFPDEGWTPSLQLPNQTYTYCQSKTGSWATTCYGVWDSSWTPGEECCSEQGVPEIIGSDSGVHFF